MTILAPPTAALETLAMMNWVMARLIPISVFAAVVALFCMTGWINSASH